MKATIQKIIEDISALPIPMNPLQVHTIFDSYPEFSAKNSPTDMEHEWAQLGVVQQLAREGVTLSEKIRNLKLYEKEFLQYTERGIVLQKESQDLDQSYSALQAEVSKSRAELTDLYNTFLIDVTIEAMPEINQLSSPEAVTKKQAENIIATRKGIKEEIKLLALPTIKMKLLELKEQQSNLLRELHNLSELHHLGLIIPRQENVNSLQIMQHSLTTALEQFILLKPQLEELQRKFAERLSTKVAQEKIAELQEAQRHMTQELERISVKITSSPLSDDKKAKLIHEFQTSTNIELLIASYSTKIDSVLAYVNPSAWITWYDNRAEYSEQQNEYNQVVEFLTLLRNQKIQQNEERSIVVQLDELTKISNSTNSTDLEERKLTEEARGLLNALPSCKIATDFNPSTSAATYYLVLIDNIFLIPQKIKHYAAPLLIIESLIPLVTQILKVRSDYNLSEEQDNLLPTISELKQALPSAELLERKQQQLKVCDTYLAKLKSLAEQLQKRTEQTKIIQDKQKEIQFNVQILKIALEKKKELEKVSTLAAQIDDHEQKLSILQHDMAQKLALINAQKAIQQHTDSKVDSTLVDTTATTTSQVTDTNQFDQSIVVDTVMSSTEQHDVLLSTPSVNGLNLAQKKDEGHINIEVIHVDTDSTIDEGITVQTTVVAGLTHDHLITKTTAAPVSSVQAVVGNSSQPLQATSDSKIHSKSDTQGQSDQQVSTIDKQEVINGTSAPTANSLECEQLHKWHQANLLALAKHPDDIKIWYHDLYTLAEHAVQQTPYSYKYSHLIRDVFFELQEKNQLAVLYAYKRMCPNPKDNVSSLLALKSNQPIVEDAFIETAEISQLPMPLHNMLEHYKKLKVKHPIEAELLRQAMYSLYFFYQQSSKNAKHSIELPLLTQDPRYVPLQRHRGFLKIWQLIEDFYHFIVGKITGQAEYEYTNKPCFFNTNSSELMEEACDFVSTTAAIGG